MNVRAVLTESLRAPSAHNAQPWRITPRADGGYELHYDHLDYLPFDPDDRDAYLAMGALAACGSVRLMRAARPIRWPGQPLTGTPTASRMTGRRYQTNCGPGWPLSAACSSPRARWPGWSGKPACCPGMIAGSWPTSTAGSAPTPVLRPA